MRKEKLMELKSLIQELQAVTIEKQNNTTGFLSIESYKAILKNNEEFCRDLLVKGTLDKHKGASIIFPITKEGNVILVVQPRIFTKSKVGVELPAGYIDSNEDELVAAGRELEEETGYKSKNWIKLASWYPDDGCSTDFNHSFLAIDCEKTGVQKFDKDEYIKLFECTVREAYELLEKGYIAGSGGIITMEKSRKLIKKLL